MGKVFNKVDTARFDKMWKEAEERRAAEEKLKERLSKGGAMRLVYFAKKIDDWYLDPLIGMLFPGMGDIITSVMCIPALYVGLFKIKSIKLSLAIFYITLFDVVTGLIPGVGDVIDFLYKANKKSARWVVGYLEKDPKTLKEINRTVIWGSIIFVAFILIMIIYFSALVALYVWLIDLIVGAFRKI